MISCPQCTYMNELDDSKCSVCLCVLKKKNVIMNQTDDNDDYPHNTYNVAVTDGIIPLIDRVLGSEGTIYRICSPCPHITQAGLEGAHWSCGYRNIQMLCHSLIMVPEYRTVLFNRDGDIPDVHGIQVWIEKAWKNGFDRMGCEQLGGSLLGRDVWIGATECMALLRYFGIRCELIQLTQRHFGDTAVASSSAATFSSINQPGGPFPYQSSATQIGRLDQTYMPTLTPHTSGNLLRTAATSPEQAEQFMIEAAIRESAKQSSHISSRAAQVVDEDDPNFDWTNYLQQNSAGQRSASTTIQQNTISASTTKPRAVSTIIDLDIEDSAVDNEDETQDDDDDEDEDWNEFPQNGKNNRNNFGHAPTNGTKRTATLQQQVAKKKAKGNTTQETELGRTLGDWVKRHFDSYPRRGPGTSTSSVGAQICPPLYFQHEGHSRTIVGYEQSNKTGKFSLLVFDPSSNGAKIKHNLETRKAVWKMQVKRSLATINRPAYQIVRIRPGLMTDGEREKSKIIDTTEQIVC